MSKKKTQEEFEKEGFKVITMENAPWWSEIE